MRKPFSNFFRTLIEIYWLENFVWNCRTEIYIFHFFYSNCRNDDDANSKQGDVDEVDDDPSTSAIDKEVEDRPSSSGSFWLNKNSLFAF